MPPRHNAVREGIIGGVHELPALLARSGRLGNPAWYQIAIGNLLAALAMGTYLWRAHPDFSHALGGTE